MTVDEIKIRQISNQYLLSPGKKLDVVQDLLGIQAQFMGNALHAMKIRSNDYDVDTAGEGLVKNWTIRGTVHVFSQNDLPLFMHCNGGKDYRRNEWTDDNFWNRREKWALTPERQRELSQVILSALAGKCLTREELREICVLNGMNEAEESSMFDPWGGGIRLLCERGFMHCEVQEKKMFCLSPEFAPIPEKEAALEMAKRYFTNYGPATIHDAMYFFHASAAQVKNWLDALPVQSTICAGKEYFYLKNDRHLAQNLTSCLFLAGFDPLMLGYEKKESLYLRKEDMRRIFNLAGIVMPALMLNGMVVGQYKHKNKKLSMNLFQRLSTKEKTLITETAELLWPDINQIEFLM